MPDVEKNNAINEITGKVKAADDAYLRQAQAAAVGDDAMATEVTDQAQLQNVGGIDLNPAMLDLQIKRDENGVPLPIFEQPIDNMRIDGFLPVIINITPVPSIPLMLGIADFPVDESDFSDSGDSPYDSKARLTESLLDAPLGV